MGTDPSTSVITFCRLCYTVSRVCSSRRTSRGSLRRLRSCSQILTTFQPRARRLIAVQPGRVIGARIAWPGGVRPEGFRCGDRRIGGGKFTIAIQTVLPPQFRRSIQPGKRRVQRRYFETSGIFLKRSSALLLQSPPGRVSRAVPLEGRTVGALKAGASAGTVPASGLGVVIGGRSAK